MKHIDKHRHTHQHQHQHCRCSNFFRRILYTRETASIQEMLYINSLNGGAGIL